MSGLLVYDGDCRFCAYWARRLERRSIQIVPGRRLEAEELLRFGLTEEDVRRSAWWVDHGKRFGGHEAIARALIASGGSRAAVGRGLLAPLISRAASVGYRLVARFRHLLPGGTPACRG